MSTKQVKTVVATSEVSQTSNMFGKLFHDGDKAMKSQSFDLVQNSLKRKIQGSYDSAQGTIYTAKQAILDERSKLINMDINVIIRAYATIESAEKAMEYTATEYETLFGESLK